MSSKQNLYVIKCFLLYLLFNFLNGLGYILPIRIDPFHWISLCKRNPLLTNYVSYHMILLLNTFINVIYFKDTLHLDRINSNRPWYFVFLLMMHMLRTHTIL